ncbi:MAG: ABC transporter permease [Anaeromyxobacter sp.]
MDPQLQEVPHAGEGRRPLLDGLGRLVQRQTFWVFVAAALAFLLLALASDVFMTRQNLFNVTRNFAFVAIIACGMTAVIITGGIDLSVGATLVLSGMVMGMTMHAGTGFWLAALLALGTALAVGALNGALIAYVGVPPFVVTLGMLSIARSLAMVLSENRMVYEFGPDQARLLTVGGGFVELGTVRVPNPVLFLAGTGLLTGFLLRETRWGRHLFAIGGNEHAALLTGVPVRRAKVGVYMFCSLCAGLAGILEIGWLGTITTSLGQGMELQVIAASVIGGANLTGGAGTALGGLMGAALIEVIRNSLTLLGISTFWQGTFVGCFIIVAVLFDRLRSRDAAG